METVNPLHAVDGDACHHAAALFQEGLGQEIAAPALADMPVRLVRTVEYRAVRLDDEGYRPFGQPQAVHQGLEAVQVRRGDDCARRPSVAAAHGIGQGQHPSSRRPAAHRHAGQQPGRAIGMGEQGARRRQPRHRLLVLFPAEADHPAVPVHHGQGGELPTDGFRIGEQGAAAAGIEAAILDPPRDVAQPLLRPRVVALRIRRGDPGQALRIRPGAGKTLLRLLEDIVGKGQKQGQHRHCRQHEELGPDPAAD